MLLAAVHHLDDAIGQIIQALEKSGQRENTLILFSSDNGPQVNWAGNAYPDDLKLTDFNQPLPMKGKKLDVYEGGIHVPGFANWPGRIQPQTIDDQVHIIDWFPTLGKLVGQAVPGNLDGQDLSPVLFKGGTLKSRDLYWVWNTKPNRWALRSGDWKMVRYDKAPPETSKDWNLYNLADDPREKTNVADQHPKILERMHGLYLKQKAKDKIK